MLTAATGEYYVVEEPESPREQAERARQETEKEKEKQKRKELAAEFSPELKKTKTTIPFFVTTPELQTSLQKSFAQLLETIERCETKKSDFYSKEAFSRDLRKKLTDGTLENDVSDDETVSGLKAKYVAKMAAFELHIKEDAVRLDEALLNLRIQKKLQEEKIIEFKKCSEAQEIGYRNKIIAVMQDAAKKYHDYLKGGGLLGKNKQKLLAKFGSVISLAKDGETLDYSKGNGLGLLFDLAKNKVERGTVDFAISQIVELNSVSALLQHFNYIIGQCTGFSQARKYLLLGMGKLVDDYTKNFKWEGEAIQLRQKTMQVDVQDVTNRAMKAAYDEKEKSLNAYAAHLLDKNTKNKKELEKEMQDLRALMEKSSNELQEIKIDGHLKEAGVYQLEAEEVQRATTCLDKIEAQIHLVDVIYRALIEKIKKLEKFKSNQLSEKKKNFLKKPLAEMRVCFEEYEKIMSDNRVIQELDQRIKTTKAQNGSQWSDKYAAKLILLQGDLQSLQKRYETLKIKGIKSYRLPYALMRFYKLKLLNHEISMRNQSIRDAERRLNANAALFLKLHNEFGKEIDSNSFSDIHALIKALQEDIDVIQTVMNEQTQLYNHAEKKLSEIKEKIDPALYSEPQMIFDSIKENYLAASAVQTKAIKYHEELLNQFGILKKYNAIVTYRNELRAKLDAVSAEHVAFNASADALDADFSRFDQEIFLEAPTDIQGLQQKIKDHLRKLDTYSNETYFAQASSQLHAIHSAKRTLQENKQENEVLNFNINPGVENLSNQYQLIEEQMLAIRQRITTVNDLSAQMKHYADLVSHHEAVNHELQNADRELVKLTILFSEIDAAAGFVDQYTQSNDIQQIERLKKRIETKSEQAQTLMQTLQKHHHTIQFNHERMQEVTAKLAIQHDEKNSPILKKTANQCSAFAEKIMQSQAKIATFQRIREETQIKHDQAWHANLDRQTAIQFIHFLYNIFMNNLVFWEEDVRYQWVGGGVSIKGLDGKDYRIATGFKTMIDDLKLFIDQPQKVDPFVTLQKIAATAQNRYDLGQTESEYTFWKARRDSVKQMYTYLKIITKLVKFDILSANISQLRNSNNKSLLLEPLSHRLNCHR